jgi:hypothetical protein
LNEEKIRFLQLENAYIFFYVTNSIERDLQLRYILFGKIKENNIDNKLARAGLSTLGELERTFHNFLKIS